MHHNSTSAIVSTTQSVKATLNIENMPYETGSKASKYGSDSIYDLDNPNFHKNLDFRPHLPSRDTVEKCNNIIKFRGFKTLGPKDLKDRKRVRVPGGEFQNLYTPGAGNEPEVDFPIYKGEIIEVRQLPLTGKERFDGK